MFPDAVCNRSLIHERGTRGQCCNSRLTKLTQHTYFLRKAHDGLLTLRNTKQHFGTRLGGCFKEQNHYKKKKGEEKRRKCGGRSTTKRTLVCSTRAETVRRRVTLSPSALFNTSTECLEFFATLPTSTSDRENSGKHCVLGYRSMLAGRCVRKHGNP